MSSLLFFVCFVAFIAAAWGLVRPYKRIDRKWFLIGTVVLFAGLPVLVPAPSASAGSPVASAPTAAAGSGQAAIVAKTEEASHGWEKYTRHDDADVLQVVGPTIFGRLTKLEPGAYYAAAESENCDKVASGAISIPQSTKGHPVWYVDCENGNRFLIAADEARAAMQRMKRGELGTTALAPNCSQSDLQACFASEAQSSANETEIVALCDGAVQDALVGGSSMDWRWDYSLESGDKVRVVRGFKAKNAFGAKLKHRYFCEVDTGSKQITSLSVEGPFETRRLI